MRPVWSSTEERERAIAAVKADPPGPSDNLLDYLERIARKAGLVRAQQDELPLREPGEEG